MAKFFFLKMDAEADTLKWALYPQLPLDYDQLQKINALVEYLAKEYIWNQDSFEFAGVGKLYFGNCIQDLWFALHILIQISKLLPEYVFSTRDDDGEFLLIETAESLSNFNPDNAENRVWIKDGILHIIPLAHIISSVDSALTLIRNQTVDTLAPSNVQEMAFARLKEFKKGYSNIHRQNALVPRVVAHVLSLDPSLITHIVHSYTEYCQIKLNIDLMKTAAQSDEPASKSNVELVRVCIAFSRLAYAQLMSTEELTKGKEADLGRKIKCGFDLIYSSANALDSLNAPAQKVKKILSDPNIFLNEVYQSYPDESDEWMYIDQKHFDDIKPVYDSDLSISSSSEDADDDSDLNESEKSAQSKPKLNGQENEQVKQLSKLFSSFNQFSSIESDTRGALFAEESSSDEDEPVEFDAEAYLECLTSKDEPVEDALTPEEKLQQEDVDAELQEHLKSEFEEFEGQVDVEGNLIKNIISSLEMQQGGPGPATTLFTHMGIKF